MLLDNVQIAVLLSQDFIILACRQENKIKCPSGYLSFNTIYSMVKKPDL